VVLFISAQVDLHSVPIKPQPEGDRKEEALMLTLFGVLIAIAPFAILVGLAINA
jgi:hypothetical protein